MSPMGTFVLLLVFSLLFNNYVHHIETSRLPLPNTSSQMKSPGYWIGKIPNPDKIILKPKEIERFNEDNFSRMWFLTKVLQIPEEIPGSEIKDMIKNDLLQIQEKKRYDKMEITNINEVASFVTKDGSIIKDVLSPLNSSLNNQSLAEATLLPGRATQEHYHSKSEEIYYILQGKGRIKIEEEVREVKPGDGIVILPGKKHKIWNTGEENLIFLCFCSPSYTHEDTIITK